MLEVGADMGNPKASVEFRGLNDPRSLQETFVLQFHRVSLDTPTAAGTAGITLVRTRGNPLNGVILPVEDYDRDYDRDSASINLPSGRVVSAVLRKRVLDNELVYAVYIDVE